MSDIPPIQPPSVLIMSDRWQSPFYGGISAAIRQLASLFHSLGLKVYCTTLKMTVEEKKDAESCHVQLICPKSPSKYWKPHVSWLHSSETYFPEIKQLQGVKIIVGFSMATSQATMAVKERILSTAKFYMACLWPTDVSPPTILGCDKDELEERLENLEGEIEVSTALASLDPKTLGHFNQMYPGFIEKTFMFFPIAEVVYLDSEPPMIPTENSEIKIVSLIEEYDLQEMISHKILSNVVNKVAEIMHDLYKQPPKWRILGIPEAKEGELKAILAPHPHLDIVPSSIPTLKHTKTELLSSHLILIPPSPGMNSLHLMLAAMAIGIPFLVPVYSPCHEVIRTYFSEYEGDMVVDMKDTAKFERQITSILMKPEIYFKKAAKVKEILRDIVIPAMKDVNKKFIDRVLQDIGGLQSPPSEGDHVDKESDNRVGESAGTAEMNIRENPLPTEGHDKHGIQDSEILWQETSETKSKKRLDLKRHISYSDEDADAEEPEPKTRRLLKGETHSSQMHLYLNAAGGIPGDASIEAIEDGYFNLPEVLEKTPQKINNLHPGLHVKGAKGHSVIYTIACDTLEALECLWREYETLHLKQIITSTTITKKTMDKIGASYFSIQTSLDIEEYEQCKKELKGKGGITTPAAAEVTHGLDDDEQMRAGLTKQNKELLLTTCTLKSEITKLQKRVMESEVKVVSFDKYVEENSKLKVKVAMLQAVLREKEIEIEILKKNLEEKEKAERVLFDRMLKVSKEKAEIQESAGKGGDKALMDENQQLKKEVTNLKTEVESLEKKILAKQGELVRLVKEMDGGEWRKTRTIEMGHPRGLTMTHLGQSVVACRDDYCVKTFTSEDQLEDELTFADQFPERFEPIDVAVSPSNVYYISDLGNLQVVVYDKVTKNVQTFCQGLKCWAIALMVGYFFVITSDNKVVKCDMVSGGSVSEVTGEIKPGLKLLDLQDLVVDKDHNVIVSDFGRSGGDGKILMFDCNLRFLRTIATELWRVRGLDIDRFGFIYTTQYLRGSGYCVIKYGNDGLEFERIKIEDDFGYIPRIAVSKVNAHKFAVSYSDYSRIDIYTKY